MNRSSLSFVKRIKYGVFVNFTAVDIYWWVGNLVWILVIDLIFVLRCTFNKIAIYTDDKESLIHDHQRQMSQWKMIAIETMSDAVTKIFYRLSVKVTIYVYVTKQG